MRDCEYKTIGWLAAAKYYRMVMHLLIRTLTLCNALFARRQQCDFFSLASLAHESRIQGWMGFFSFRLNQINSSLRSEALVQSLDVIACNAVSCMSHFGALVDRCFQIMRHIADISCALHSIRISISEAQIQVRTHTHAHRARPMWAWTHSPSMCWTSARCVVALQFQELS